MGTLRPPKITERNYSLHLINKLISREKEIWNNKLLGNQPTLHNNIKINRNYMVEEADAEVERLAAALAESMDVSINMSDTQLYN